MTGRTGEDPFAGHAGLAAGVVAVGLVLGWVLPRLPETRLPACVGVGLAGLSGAVALVLKRRAVRRDLKAALKSVGVVFGLRAVMVAAGLYWVVSRGLEAVAFVMGFFGVYFALQWIEISYVMAASKDAPGGDE